MSRDTQCSQSNVGNTPSFNRHIELYSGWPPLHLRIPVTLENETSDLHKGIILTELQQMWSQVSEELDVLDDHTQIASRAGEGTRRTTQINMKFRIYSNKHSGRQ